MILNKSNIFQKNMKLDIDEVTDCVLFLSRIEIYFQTLYENVSYQIQYDSISVVRKQTNSNRIFTQWWMACNRKKGCPIRLCNRLCEQQTVNHRPVASEGFISVVKPLLVFPTTQTVALAPVFNTAVEAIKHLYNVIDRIYSLFLL